MVCLKYIHDHFKLKPLAHESRYQGMLHRNMINTPTEYSLQFDSKKCGYQAFFRLGKGVLNRLQL